MAGHWNRSNRGGAFGGSTAQLRAELPFFAQQSSSLLHGSWEVVQLAKPAHAPPGVYRLWTLLRSAPNSYDLYPILLRVPRLYV
jgi:hypothetical protein